MTSCQNICCGECINCKFILWGGMTKIIIKHTLRGECSNITFFKKRTTFPVAWYFAAKYPYVATSFKRWMAEEEPYDHPDMIKHDNTFVFTGISGVKISFKKDEDSGKKTVEFSPVHPEQAIIPCFNFQAICFKRMIETDLETMEYIIIDG